ncbi:Alcohol dehydrogenase [acceptor] [Legionella busanensis]|uniref:Alcohol dehydrogenase [acceptor] n=1 Tax=Legionella busanensis TaxID=190655 RepID=A0A378JP64_9GAMM|nr:GMC family oxidoreductase N-terminal domain-containing protein [Legionella busanensis]STX51770.1 Alcohol dehydrogenase [acceptor] [Legionella busanensis]
MKTFDYIIIGGGTAGCVLANRLSKNPNHSVLLLEAGHNSSHIFSQLPVGQAKVVGNPNWDWQFLAEPDLSCANRQMRWPAGKCLGGSSSINGMVYVRGHKLDYDHWHSLGNQGWAYEEVLPFFKKMELFAYGDLNYRGDCGPLKVREIIKPHPLTQVFIAAAQELKIPFNPDYNSREQEGVGICQTNQTKRIRHSTAAAYLKPARHRKNLIVLTKAFVHKIHLLNQRAYRVSVQLSHGLEDFFATKEIILCAGSIQSPKILLQSGIGSPEELHSSCIHALPGVGKNLQEHPNTWISAFVNTSTYNTDLHIWRATKHLRQWLIKGGGAIATPIAHAICFIKTALGIQQPDIQIHFTPFSYEFDNGKLSLTKRPAIVLTPNICRPVTRGSITLSSADPTSPPLINYQALAEEKDVETLVAGCRIARKIINTSAFKPYLVAERFPGKDVDDVQLIDYIRHHSSLGYHPAGTCKMGCDPMAVVDASLKIHGLMGLRVADASIMPVITSGNTNAPTIMIAEKAAYLILQEHSK